MGLRGEADARRRAGFACSYLPRSAVRARYGIKGRSALLGFDNLVADPRRLAAGFLNAALGRGARLFAPAEIMDIQTSRTRVRAATRHGPVITCRSLVFATGYEIPKVVPTAGNHIASNWVIATRPQRRALWPSACFIWEASAPYLYVRTTPDHRIIGGNGITFSMMAAQVLRGLITGVGDPDADLVSFRRRAR